MAKSDAAWTVDVSASTTFTERTISSASFATVCVGDRVAAAGTISGTTVTANLVMIGGAWAHHFGPATGTHQSSNDATGLDKVQTTSGGGNASNHGHGGYPTQGRGGSRWGGPGHGGGQGHGTGGGQDQGGPQSH
jgi:hypothetical protein